MALSKPCNRVCPVLAEYFRNSMVVPWGIQETWERQGTVPLYVRVVASKACGCRGPSLNKPVNWHFDSISVLGSDGLVRLEVGYISVFLLGLLFLSSTTSLAAASGDNHHTCPGSPTANPVSAIFIKSCSPSGLDYSVPPRYSSYYFPVKLN